MMGLEVLGALLLALAMSLMTVCPLQLMIARHKDRPLPISATLQGVYDVRSEAPALDQLAHDAEEALARLPRTRAAARLAETYRNT